MRTFTQSQKEKLNLKPKIIEIFEEFENAEIIDINDSEIIFEDIDRGGTYIASYIKESNVVYLDDIEEIDLGEDQDKPLSLKEAVDQAFHIKTSDEDAISVISETLKTKVWCGKKRQGALKKHYIGRTSDSIKKQKQGKKQYRQNKARFKRIGNNPVFKNRRALALRKLQSQGILKRLRLISPGLKKGDARKKTNESVSFIEGTWFPFEKEQINERLAFTIDSDEATYEISVVKKDTVAPISSMPMMSEPPPETSMGAMKNLKKKPTNEPAISTGGEDLGSDMSQDELEGEGGKVKPLEDIKNENLIYIHEGNDVWNPYFIKKDTETLSEARNVIKGFRKNEVFEEKIAKLLAIADQNGIDEAKTKWKAFAQNWQGLYLLDESELNDMFLYLMSNAYEDTKVIQEAMDIINELLSDEDFKSDRDNYLASNGYSIDSLILKEDAEGKFRKTFDSNVMTEIHKALTTMCEYEEIQDEPELLEEYADYANSVIDMVKSGFINDELISEIMDYGFDITNDVITEDEAKEKFIDDPDFVLEGDEDEGTDLFEQVDTDEHKVEKKVKNIEAIVNAENVIDMLEDKLEDIEAGIISDEPYKIQESIKEIKNMLKRGTIDEDVLTEVKKTKGLATVSGEPMYKQNHSAYSNQIGNAHQEGYRDGSTVNKSFPQVSCGSISGS